MINKILPKSLLFLLFFLLIVRPQNLCAQKEKSSPFMISILSGTTYSRIKSFPAPGVKEANLPDKTQTFTLGYFGGATISYTYKKRFILTTGMQYMVNKIRYSIPEVLFLNPDSTWEPANGKIRNNTHSLYIPLQISFLFHAKPNTPFITVGSALNLYRGTVEKFTIYKDKDNAELASGTLKYKMKDYNGKNFCVVLGGGYNFKVSKVLNGSAFMMYNMSTSRLFDSNLNVSVNHRINFIQLGLGINYTL